MTRLAALVINRRWWVIGAWIVLALAGGFAAPRAVSNLSYAFDLPGQPASIANQKIAAHFGATGGDNAPVILLVKGSSETTDEVASQLKTVVHQSIPSARIATWVDQPKLRSIDGSAAVALVYPPVAAGPKAYATAIPKLERAIGQARIPATLTGVDVVAQQGGGGVSVLAETIFGALAALVVLVLVFGSFLALTPLCVAAASILTAFLLLWGLTGLTQVSFVSQYLLALIGLGVAIDYALLIVTRWREERGNGVEPEAAVIATITSAGRSVLFSGATVAISLAALVVLPVPFLRSIGFAGLLIPILAAAAALTLLPAILLVVGDQLSWPHRRCSSPDSHLWAGIGRHVVRHRWISIVGGLVILLVLAAPVLGLRLGAATNSSMASTGGPAAAAISTIDDSGIGRGVTQPMEILTSNPGAVLAALDGRRGISGAVAPDSWRSGRMAVVDAWTTSDPTSTAGSTALKQAREAVERAGGEVGGIPVQNLDFIHAVYGNAIWVLLIIVIVTMILLSMALRSIVLPVKALALNVVSIGAAYGVTVLIWQDGFATKLLFNEQPAGAITVWVPIAVFAFLFGLSMDYEVFLLSRIREEHDRGHSTDEATVAGVSRTGRLVTSGALILFFAFISLSQIPQTEVKILATGLALGIIIDATLVRGVLAPALVAALGQVNWWLPQRFRRDHSQA